MCNQHAPSAARQVQRAKCNTPRATHDVEHTKCTHTHHSNMQLIKCITRGAGRHMQHTTCNTSMATLNGVVRYNVPSANIKQQVQSTRAKCNNQVPIEINKTNLHPTSPKCEQHLPSATYQVQHANCKQQSPCATQLRQFDTTSATCNQHLPSASNKPQLQPTRDR